MYSNGIFKRLHTRLQTKRHLGVTCWVPFKEIEFTIHKKITDVQYVAYSSGGSMHKILCNNEFFFLPLTIHCAQWNPPKIGTELCKVWNVVCYLTHKNIQISILVSQTEIQDLMKNINTHLTFIPLFSSVVDLIYDTNKCLKLWNDKFLSESLGEQDDVSAYTSDRDTIAWVLNLIISPFLYSSQEL